MTVSPAVPGVDRNLALTVVIMTAPGGGLRFGGGERGPGLARVAMAELGVGGLGQAEPPALFPLGCLLVACRGVEFGLACAVGVAHCLVAGGQRFLPGCLVVLAAAAGRAGFGVGAERCQVRITGGGAGLAELADGRQRRPGIVEAGGAEVEELAIGQVPDVPGLVEWEGGAGLVPGGAQVRAPCGGLGSDRVVGMVVAGQLAVGADRGGLALPVQAGGGVVRGRPERSDRPRQGAGGGVLTDAAPAVVHGGGELDEEPAASGVTGLGNLGGPGRGGERDQMPVAAADAGVDHGGDVTGAGQVPFGDGPGQDLARVQARELGGAQRPVQPLLLVAVLLAGSRG